MPKVKPMVRSVHPILETPVTIEATVMAQIIMDTCDVPPWRAGEAADLILEYLSRVIVGGGAAVAVPPSENMQ